MFMKHGRNTRRRCRFTECEREGLWFERKVLYSHRYIYPFLPAHQWVVLCSLKSSDNNANCYGACKEGLAWAICLGFTLNSDSKDVTRLTNECTEYDSPNDDQKHCFARRFKGGLSSHFQCQGSRTL